ncbi:MAG: hypothetical protein CL506_04765 [Actinobacteria bacterium]|nr:hypothetical protein [Actinomycetota bacterium]
MKLLKEKIIGLILIPLTLVLGCAGGDAGLENIQQRGYSDSSRLVSTEWLSSHLNDKNLVVVDLRKKEDYDAGHIPGALHLTPGEVFQQTINGVKGLLPTRTHIEKHLGSIGLTPESTIVLYDGKANLWSSRGLWAMDVYGHKNTKLLDGVWTKWSAENRATSTETPTVKAYDYRFSGIVNDSLVANWEEVLNSIEDPSKIVCDTRSPEEYAGKDVRADRGGHIPDAKNVNWILGAEESGEFKSAAELKTLYKNAGVTDGKTIFTLCQTAVRATHTWFILSDLLGHDDVKVYDGSWIEWGNNPDLPIKTGG